MEAHCENNRGGLYAIGEIMPEVLASIERRIGGKLTRPQRSRPAQVSLQALSLRVPGPDSTVHVPA